ncbi:autotransporter domain-containing protein [Vulcaniibacterium gelatinicum]|uniref:autotransporter domain-containing protein n=1 Tax=Vulcaniibacterium gelatinicum TaxID=2598725 RepID=UPI0011CBFB1E|nr:autotransporter domain-containing protein [Vulcaniibacterium gelatinicum]
MKPSRLTRSALACALALVFAPVAAQTYSQTVFFGDSLTDAGFYRPILPPSAQAVTGRFTTNPGLVWAEFLAQYYGTDAAPAWQLTSTGIAPGTGDNYAAGGATINLGPGFPPTNPTQFAPSIGLQIQAHLSANGGRADPNALYTVWGGANDLFFHLNGLTTQATFLAAAGREVTLVQSLQNAGARYILVPTMPDVGRTPFGLSLGPAGSAGVTTLVQTYNTTLFNGLQQAGVRVIPLDTFHFLREIAAAPSAYGLVNVTAPACGSTSSLVCTPGNLVAPGANETFAFADGVHPTTAGHRLLADFAISVLEAPRQIAVLPHSAAMVGRARAERVAQHWQGGEGEGMRWWADVRGDNQRYGDGDDYDGMGPTLTFGVDWVRGAFAWGAFAGYGRQDIDFGQRRGEFEQSDATLGGFVGWRGDGPWVNAQVSYSRLGFDVEREVHLGPATRVHRGSPDGDNLTVAASAGWEFGGERLRHGPVLAVISQRIEVDGYAEDSTESTALAYPEQAFDSLIGSIGWQASYAIHDHLVPYARLTVDREFEDPAEEAFAQSRSMPGTAPFAVPGLDRDQDYATITFGARTRLFGLDANIGASATVQQGGGNDATVFVTLGGGF